MNNSKAILYIIISIPSVAGTFLSNLFGGWNTSLVALIIFMALDYLTGLICSLIWKKSDKSESGAYDSKVGFRGTFQKSGHTIYDTNCC